MKGICHMLGKELKQKGNETNNFTLVDGSGFILLHYEKVRPQ